MASASHLEFLASHGLHVAFLANGELVGHGVAPGIVLGPGEVLPILLHLCDNLEVATLFNGVTGEPWAQGQAEGPCKSYLQSVALRNSSPLLRQASLTVKSTNPSSTMSHAIWPNTSPCLSVFIHKMGIIRPISQGCCKD